MCTKWGHHSIPHGDMTDLNDKSEHNHVGEDQVSLVSIHDVIQTLWDITVPSLQTYSNESTSHKQHRQTPNGEKRYNR